MNFEKFKKNLEDMKMNLDFMSDMNKEILNMIKDKKQKKEFAEISADTQIAIESIKKGDMSALTNLQEKYADQDNK